MLAATAWRQLAANGYGRASWEFEDLMERIGNALTGPLRGELVAGLSYVLEEDYYEQFLQLARDTGARRALRSRVS